MVKAIKENLPDMWKASPPWFALLAVVVLFLFYLDRQEQRVIEREKRAEKLSEMRIETCHLVQVKSTKAIEDLNAILREQIRALDRLTLITESQ